MEGRERRGFGKAPPVGWHPIPRPTGELREKMFQHIKACKEREQKDREKQDELDKKRKNNEQKIAWHKEQINFWGKKSLELNNRLSELRTLHDNLYSQLKEVIARGRGSKVHQQIIEKKQDENQST